MACPQFLQLLGLSPQKPCPGRTWVPQAPQGLFGSGEKVQQKAPCSLIFFASLVAWAFAFSAAFEVSQHFLYICQDL